MPTMSRLVAALLLAATGYAGSELYYPILPEGTAATWMSETIAALGLIVGWRVVGRDAEAGEGALTLAFKAGIYLLFWTLAVFACQEMYFRSIRKVYKDPFSAVLDIPAIGFDYLLSALVPNVMAALVIGAFVTALCARGTARYFSGPFDRG